MRGLADPPALSGLPLLPADTLDTGPVDCAGDVAVLEECEGRLPNPPEKLHFLLGVRVEIVADAAGGLVARRCKAGGLAVR